MSFLSVFHYSNADQPLEETIVVASKLLLFLLYWIVYKMSNVDRVFFLFFFFFSCALNVNILTSTL